MKRGRLIARRLFSFVAETWILGRYPSFTPCINPTNPLFGFPCQSCSESCAFQAVAAMVDFVYESKPYRKKQRRGKYLLDSPSESSWSVEKSGRQHRKNGLRVDALKGSFLQARPDAPVRQAAVSRMMNPSVLIEMAIARLS